MSSIVFSGKEKYDLDSLCGTTKRITLYKDKNNNIIDIIPGTKKKNIHIEFLMRDNITIDEICDKYNIKKYYMKGKYDTERIIPCCILPCEIIKTYDILNGYLFFNFSTDNKSINDIVTLYEEGNIFFSLFEVTLYENPIECGKLYVKDKLDVKYNQYKIIKEEYNNLDTYSLDSKICEIEKKYEELKQNEIEKTKREIEEKKKMLSEKADEIILYFNRNKDISLKLGINLNEYDIR